MHSEAVAYAILVALCATVVWYAGRARRAIYLADDMQDLQDRMTRLEGRQKLTQGRLNSIAPPREGTGAGNGEAELERPLSRSELYAAALRRKGGRT